MNLSGDGLGEVGAVEDRGEKKRKSYQKQELRGTERKGLKAMA